MSGTLAWFVSQKASIYGNRAVSSLPSPPGTWCRNMEVSWDVFLTEISSAILRRYFRCEPKV
jgi:hypothetical protein